MHDFQRTHLATWECAEQGAGCGGRRAPCYGARVRTLAATLNQERAHACAPVKTNSGVEVQRERCEFRRRPLRSPVGVAGTPDHGSPPKSSPLPNSFSPQQAGHCCTGRIRRNTTHKVQRSACLGRRKQDPEAPRVACAPRAQARAGHARDGEE